MRQRVPSSGSARRGAHTQEHAHRVTMAGVGVGMAGYSMELPVRGEVDSHGLAGQSLQKHLPRKREREGRVCCGARVDGRVGG